MNKATNTVSPTGPRQAQSPFHFNSAAYLLRIGRERAASLHQLLDALHTCPDDSIFQHTFRTLQEHHFIREGYSNDFAHWAYTACHEPELAERLAGVDIRIFTSVSDLRESLVQIVERHLRENPDSRDREAQKAFYFCASDEVVMPTGYVAKNLDEFLSALKVVNLHSVHHHFIEARLRLRLCSNDFSLWLEKEMGLKQVAEEVDRIDIYTSTLQEVRERIVNIIESGLMTTSVPARPQ